MARCIKCGFIIKDDDMFCPECGAMQHTGDKVCIGCGRKISADTRFCPECGMKIADETADTETDKFTNEDSSNGESEHESDTAFAADSSAAQDTTTDEETKNNWTDEPSFAGDSYKYDEGTSYSGMAIAGFVLAFFFPILGIIFSAIGMGQTKDSRMKGRGLAIAGLTISIVFCCLGFLLAMVSGLSFTVMSAF